MHVLVTGGAGFIGCYLTRRLLAEGHRVTVMDNFFRASRESLADVRDHSLLSIYEGDIRRYADFEKLPSGIEMIYHLAAQSNVMGAVSGLDYSFETNVGGTYNALKFARERSVRRFVFASSRESYGEAQYIPVDENHPLNSKNAYGASKLCGERYCAVFNQTYGLDVFTVRLANVYGRGDSNRVIPIFIDKALRGEALTIYGGKQLIDFIGVETVTDVFMEIMTHEGSAEAVNVGSGRGTTLFDLAEEILKLSGSASPLEVLPAREVEVVRFVADTKRFRKIFRTSLPENPLSLLPQMISDEKKSGKC